MPRYHLELTDAEWREGGVTFGSVPNWEQAGYHLFEIKRRHKMLHRHINNRYQTSLTFYPLVISNLKDIVFLYQAVDCENLNVEENLRNIKILVEKEFARVSNTVRR